MRRLRLTTACSALLMIGSAVAAQTTFNQTAAQSENQRRLSRYQWRTKVEMNVKGKMWANAVFQSRYDDDGKVVQTQVGGGEVDPNLGLRFIRQNQHQIKKEGIDTLAVAVVQQVRAYVELPADQAQAVMARATREPGTGEMQGTDRLTARGVLKENDRVTIWVDRQSGIQKRMEVESVADGRKFKSTWSFAKLSNGVWYPAKRTDEIPEKQVQLVTVNSDYM
jgi:hypothetical protein